MQVGDGRNIELIYKILEIVIQTLPANHHHQDVDRFLGNHNLAEKNIKKQNQTCTGLKRGGSFVRLNGSFATIMTTGDFNP